MGTLERDIGKLIAEVKAIGHEIESLKKDVRSLLEFKWRIYGATALIALVCSAMVEVAVAFSKK
jgi:hypothetical protein